MGKIVSQNNDRVRRVRALQRSTRRRRHEGVMIVEGLRLAQEALNSGLPIDEAYFTRDFAESAGGSVVVASCTARALPLWRVSPAVMQALSDTETPQGIVLLMPIPDIRCKDGRPFTLIPDGVRDPGNLGTILRTAWAAGVSQVLLPPGTVDVSSPKVLRSGMGAHFHVPMYRMSWDEIRIVVADAAVWLAEAAQGVPYDAVDWHGRVALVVGGEAFGAGAEARALAQDRCVYIPMATGVDSLNAAMATSVLIFEAARQRGVGRI